MLAVLFPYNSISEMQGVRILDFSLYKSMDETQYFSLSFCCLAWASSVNFQMLQLFGYHQLSLQSCLRVMTFKVLVMTIDALGHFETG